jgi:hypothetical protein
VTKVVLQIHLSGNRSKFWHSPFNFSNILFNYLLSCAKKIPKSLHNWSKIVNLKTCAYYLKQPVCLMATEEADWVRKWLFTLNAGAVKGHLGWKKNHFHRVGTPQSSYLIKHCMHYV